MTDGKRMLQYIREREVFTLPELQRRFGIGFAEAREFVSRGEKDGYIIFDKGLTYLCIDPPTDNEFFISELMSKTLVNSSNVPSKAEREKQERLRREINELVTNEAKKLRAFDERNYTFLPVTDVRLPDGKLLELRLETNSKGEWVITDDRNTFLSLERYMPVAYFNSVAHSVVRGMPGLQIEQMKELSVVWKRGTPIAVQAIQIVYLSLSIIAKAFSLMKLDEATDAIICEIFKINYCNDIKDIRAAILNLGRHGRLGYNEMKEAYSLNDKQCERFKKTLLGIGLASFDEETNSFVKTDKLSPCLIAYLNEILNRRVIF